MAMKRLIGILLVATMIMAMTPGVSASAITTDSGTVADHSPVVQPNLTCGTVSDPSPVVQPGLTYGAVANPAPLTPTVLTSGIKGVNEAQFISIVNQLAQNGKIELNGAKSGIRSVTNLAELELVPGDKITIPLTADMFLDSKGKAFASGPVSLSALSSGEITVRSTVTTGSGLVKISLEGNKSGSNIKIEFLKSPVADGKKFSYAAYLAHKGVRKSETRLPVKGVLEAARIEVNADSDYADISKGQTVKALSNVKSIDLYLGEDCTITRNLIKGREYSGTASTDILVKDEILFTKYRDLEYIYKLQTVGLKVAGNIVTFDLDSNYYVYNTNGAYIGTTAKALPYWTTYYLTSKKYESIAVVK